MTDHLAFQDLEKVYELVAKAIDEVGPEREAVFLSKLCLTLAHNVTDVSFIEKAINIASSDLNS
jgi:hypothetical protein